MHTQAPNLEWRIAENDAEWERQQALLISDATPIIGSGVSLKQYLWNVAPLFLALAMIICWWWEAIQSIPQQGSGAATAITKQVPTQVAPDHASMNTAIEHIHNVADPESLHEQEIRSLRFVRHNTKPATYLETVKNWQPINVMTAADSSRGSQMSPMEQHCSQLPLDSVPNACHVWLIETSVLGESRQMDPVEQHCSQLAPEAISSEHCH